MIIDDYVFWKGVRKAVDDYFGDNREFFYYVDHSCRLLIKNRYIINIILLINKKFINPK